MKWRGVLRVARREVLRFGERPLILTVSLVMPLTFLFLFLYMMGEGLPRALPCGVVDEDDTQISRTIVRTIDAMMETDITHRYSSVGEARHAMQRGEIYAFIHIPSGTTDHILGYRQPRVAFYANDSYFLPASLLMKDLRLAGEMLPLAVSREVMYARGATVHQAMARIQPIAIETHPLSNPTLNYSVYLSNIIVPGLTLLIIMLLTAYHIGIERKRGTAGEWLAAADGDPFAAIVGKTLPHTLLFWLLFTLYQSVMFGLMGFPCQCPFWHINLVGLLCILAAQGFAIASCQVFGNLRLSLSCCSLWGVMGVTLSGFTFPQCAMDLPLRALSWTCPLRHYYLLYVNRALEGNPLLSEYGSLAALLCFLLLPLLLWWRWRSLFINSYE